MALSKEKKDKIIKKFRTHDSDTGSPEVQIAILTEEIRELTDHLKQHRADFSSRRGLLRKVQERKKLMRYLQRENEKAYFSIIKTLKIKPLVVLEISEFEEEMLEQEREREKAEKER
jgi:small subunit ribosomal protein S15